MSEQSRPVKLVRESAPAQSPDYKRVGSLAYICMDRAKRVLDRITVTKHPGLNRGKGPIS